MLRSTIVSSAPHAWSVRQQPHSIALTSCKSKEKAWKDSEVDGKSGPHRSYVAFSEERSQWLRDALAPKSRRLRLLQSSSCSHSHRVVGWSSMPYLQVSSRFFADVLENLLHKLSASVLHSLSDGIWLISISAMDWEAIHQQLVVDSMLPHWLCRTTSAC